MMTFPIFHRWSTRPIAMVEADTYPQALELAVARGVRMLYADLKGIKVQAADLEEGDFRGADLGGSELVRVNLRKADLRAARLVGADLRGASLALADLRQADLRSADLRQANLAGARLVGADLRGAVLTGAQLDGAILDWRWSAIPVELVRRDGKCSIAALKLVAELAFQDDARPFAWIKRLGSGRGEQAALALEVFARSMRPGDNAPELLRRLAADVPSAWGGPGASPPAVVPMLWTRRGGPAVVRQG